MWRAALAADQITSRNGYGSSQPGTTSLTWQPSDSKTAAAAAVECRTPGSTAAYPRSGLQATRSSPIGSASEAA